MKIHFADSEYWDDLGEDFQKAYKKALGELFVVYQKTALKMVKTHIQHASAEGLLTKSLMNRIEGCKEGLTAQLLTEEDPNRVFK